MQRDLAVRQAESDGSEQPEGGAERAAGRRRCREPIVHVHCHVRWNATGLAKERERPSRR